MNTFPTGRITAITTRTIYEIPPGAPVRWTPRVAGHVRVRVGRIWLTREGDAGDYWLAAGAGMPVAAGDVLWASVEGDVPGRLEMCSQASRMRLWRQAWHVLRAWRGGTASTANAGAAPCDATALPRR
ncbi:DUF2917 domain-containing protein [Robbsia sp. Bb-Pol-6]|uniref:DUF2917 domain-containing protein n=1 Tax=Robbsia betulipollinis TaxID=2981849 RepID=A0ABT3ZRP8_9BURK|nr:DUF2917 domain-containing protein [Robbsia betulipollinis]MCY0389092.1 DUF2917 domain-containing protein [Robbsia betulipollinis]